MSYYSSPGEHPHAISETRGTPPYPSAIFGTGSPSQPPIRRVEPSRAPATETLTGSVASPFYDNMLQLKLN